MKAVTALDTISNQQIVRCCLLAVFTCCIQREPVTVAIVKQCFFKQTLRNCQVSACRYSIAL